MGVSPFASGCSAGASDYCLGGECGSAHGETGARGDCGEWGGRGDYPVYCCENHGKEAVGVMEGGKKGGSVRKREGEREQK